MLEPCTRGQRREEHIASSSCRRLHSGLGLRSPIRRLSNQFQSKTVQFKVDWIDAPEKPYTSFTFRYRPAGWIFGVLRLLKFDHRLTEMLRAQGILPALPQAATNRKRRRSASQEVDQDRRVGRRPSPGNDDDPEVKQEDIDEMRVRATAILFRLSGVLTIETVSYFRVYRLSSMP